MSQEQKPADRMPPALTIADLRARYRRLDRLGRGLAKERTCVRIAHRASDTPFLLLEWRAYDKALGDAIGGVEDARVTLAKALQRLEPEKTADGRMPP